MDKSMECSERTLVMFDSVCAGLDACLSLVHADIRQMSEHRNRLLAQIDHEQQYRAKLEQLEAEVELGTDYYSSLASDATTSTTVARRSPSNVKAAAAAAGGGRPKLSDGHKRWASVSTAATATSSDNEPEADPHYLSKLKSLDKRLADSFSHALSMSDLQKSSLNAKFRQRQQLLTSSGQQQQQQQQQCGRTSIFQLLLGRSSRSLAPERARRKSHSAGAKSRESASEKSADSRVIIDDINRQTRLAMQYSKQLEAQLLKVEDLRAKYEMHLKMSLVVKTSDRYNNNCDDGNGQLSKSCVNLNASQSLLRRNKSKNGSQPRASKSSVKEFIENIDKIEAEFESYMGSFLLAIEDIQGFARVCQGDVFEITIKYGESQKFKTKISVLKDNKQKCDNRQIVFKAKIADVLAIKAHECKGLGKRTLLGNKLCETRDLFTARSQLMTISLNQTGSIKLNLIVTWNPLHLAPSSSSALPGLDISHISLPATPIPSSKQWRCDNNTNFPNTTRKPQICDSYDVRCQEACAFPHDPHFLAKVAH